MGARMSVIQYRRLRSDEADQTYVLARMADPRLAMESWRAMVGSAPSAGGVLGAVGDSGVRAVLAYSISTNPAGERQLMVETLVAFDLLRPENLIQPLVSAACELARRECDSIGVSARMDAPGLEAILRQIADAAVLHRVI